MPKRKYHGNVFVRKIYDEKLSHWKKNFAEKT